MSILLGSEIGAYVPPRLTDEQMAEIERAIWQSPDAAEDVKPLLIWLLRQSEHCTKRVALTLLASEFGEAFTDSFQTSVHDMLSSQGATQITSVFQKFGTEARFSHHFGILSELNGKRVFSTESVNERGRTVWVSWGYYDSGAEPLAHPGKEALAAIVRP